LKLRIIYKLRHKLPEYTILNSAGMYLLAMNDENVIIKVKEMACQAKVAKHERPDWIASHNLKQTELGSGRFGRTGKH
jgi:dUTPase